MYRGELDHPKVLIASTCAAWKVNGRGEMSWLKHAEKRMEDAAAHGIEVEHFMALEVDRRGLTPFEGLVLRMMEVDPNFVIWTFMIDDPSMTEYTGSSRLPRICTGRNLAIEYAQQRDHSHILYLDTDTKVPSDCVPKLLDVGRPITGGEVPNYGLHGEPIRLRVDSDEEYPYPVEEHWNTAGFLLVSRPVFRKIRWRWDDESGLTDDPCYQNDANDAGFGMTWVRKDVVGVHEEALVGVEDRTDADRRFYR